MSVPEQQATCPPDLKAVVNFLRGKSGMKLHTGVLNGKRVEYFKGNAVAPLQGVCPWRSTRS
jgi:translocation protein SEC62